MKFRTSHLLAGLALMLAAPATRAELDLDIVPASSKWVVYADFEALRESELGQAIVDRIPAFDLAGNDSPIQPDVARIMETVGRATAFGRDLSGQHDRMDGAMILEGTSALRSIAEGLVAQISLSDPDEVVELTDLPIEAHRVHGEIVVGFPEEPIILVARSSERLMEVLETFRGQRDSLAKRSGELSNLLPSTSDYYLYATSVVPSAEIVGDENTPQARVLQMTRAASFLVGEDGENAVVRVRLEAGDNGVAEKLEKILLGLTAMLSLAESNDEDLTEFINSVSVDRDERQISLQLAYSTSRVLAMVEEHLQAAEQAHSQANDYHAEDLWVEGELVAEWVADAESPADAPAANSFFVHTSDPVSLKTGDLVIVTAAAHNGEHARVDFVDLIPVDSGASRIRHEAEFLRLENYHIESSEHASGGELITNHGGRATARLRVAESPGMYRIAVGYVDESDGAGPFKLSTVTIPVPPVPPTPPSGS